MENQNLDHHEIVAKWGAKSLSIKSFRSVVVVAGLLFVGVLAFAMFYYFDS